MATGTKFQIDDVICNIYPTTPHHGTVYAIDNDGYSCSDFTGGMFAFGFGAEPEFVLCDPPEGSDPCTSTLLGDVNGDGVVDQADADLLYNWMSFSEQRETTYKLACPENADVNGDGEISMADAVLLMNHVADPDNPEYAFGQYVPPECTTGDVKQGHVCEDGFWEETETEPKGPPAGTTIEFQEMIPGFTPPRVPLLVAGFESLPLLPGWIVRNALGNIVNEGAKLPTLKDITG